MIESFYMFRRKALWIAAALVMAALLAAYLLRPVTIQDNGAVWRTRGAALTTSSALSAVGISLDPADHVEPAPGRIIPLNGLIRVQRAVQVYLWEDGQGRHLRGFTANPFALLAENEIALGAGDQLLWDGQALPPDSELPAGKPVVLQLIRARTIILDAQGQRRAISTRAATTARALWEAGVRLGPGDLLSAPAGNAPAANGVITYQPARTLTIQVAGHVLHARSSAQTVGQALAEAGVSIQGLDTVQPAEDQPLPQDGQIRVSRVHEELSLKETFIPYDQKTEPDPNLDLDQRRVTRAGQYGVKVARERARFVDGQEVSRGFDSDWVASEPVAQVTGIGTKVVAQSLDVGGEAIQYYRAVRVYATSYSPCNQMADHCSWSTSSGIRLSKGVIAVTLSWYRQLAGSRVYVPGYGYGVIGDVGGGIPGTPWIDLGFDEDSFKTGAFVGWVTMYLLAPAPANVPLNFP